MNPLFQQMNNQSMPNLLRQFMQFKQGFKGNPQEQVQQLLNSGKVTQEQYDNAVRMVNSLQRFLK